MRVGGENSSGGLKERFASRDGPGERRTLGNAIWGMEEVTDFCSCHTGNTWKRSKNERAPSGEKTGNWKFLGLRGSTSSPPPRRRLPGNWGCTPESELIRWPSTKNCASSSGGTTSKPNPFVFYYSPPPPPPGAWAHEGPGRWIGQERRAVGEGLKTRGNGRGCCCLRCVWKHLKQRFMSFTSQLFPEVALVAK